MNRTFIRLLLVAGIFALSAGAAWAQEDETDAAAAGRKILYKAKTEIDFEGVEVAGELVKPQGALLLDRKRGAFNPLIKLRSDFNQEMDQSVNEIK
jgi:hypothetical protein